MAGGAYDGRWLASEDNFPGTKFTNRPDIKGHYEHYEQYLKKLQESQPKVEEPKLQLWSPPSPQVTNPANIYQGYPAEPVSTYVAPPVPPSNRVQLNPPSPVPSPVPGSYDFGPSITPPVPRDEGEIRQGSPYVGGPSVREILEYGPGQKPGYMYNRNLPENYYEPTWENFLEFFDPTGVTSHDDARAAYERMRKRDASMPTFDEALDMFGVIPMFRKAKIPLRVISKIGDVSGLDRLRRIYNNYREVQKGINAADVLEDEGILKYGGGLRRWFKEEWTDVKTGEPCGRESASNSSRPYPYCRPANKVSSETPATTKHPEAKKRAKSKTGPTTRVKPITR